MDATHSIIIANAIKTMREVDETIASIRAEVLSYTQHHGGKAMPKPANDCGIQPELNSQHVASPLSTIRPGAHPDDWHVDDVDYSITPTTQCVRDSLRTEAWLEDYLANH